MNDTDKVIIALGFFTLVGFISYLYFMRVSPTAPVSLSDGMSVSDLKKIREQRYVVARR